MGETKKIELEMILKQLRIIYWEKYKKVLVFPEKVGNIKKMLSRELGEKSLSECLIL